MLGSVGVITKKTSVARFTVSVVDADTLPDVAEIVAEPAATEVASPFDRGAWLKAGSPVDAEH